MESTRTIRIVSRTILVMMLIALLMLLLPIWPYNSSWNYYPILAVVLGLAVLASVFFRSTWRHL